MITLVHMDRIVWFTHALTYMEQYVLLLFSIYDRNLEIATGSSFRLLCDIGKAKAKNNLRARSFGAELHCRLKSKLCP